MAGWRICNGRGIPPRSEWRTEPERCNNPAFEIRAFAVTGAAVARHETLRKMKLNVGRNDLRLAALALELDAIVVTDNVRDFGRVSGLRWVDWTK